MVVGAAVLSGRSARAGGPPSRMAPLMPVGRRPQFLRAWASTGLPELPQDMMAGCPLGVRAKRDSKEKATTFLWPSPRSHTCHFSHCLLGVSQ